MLTKATVVVAKITPIGPTGELLTLYGIWGWEVVLLCRGFLGYQCQIAFVGTPTDVQAHALLAQVPKSLQTWKEFPLIKNMIKIIFVEYFDLCLMIFERISRSEKGASRLFVWSFSCVRLCQFTGAAERSNTFTKKTFPLLISHRDDKFAQHANVKKRKFYGN